MAHGRPCCTTPSPGSDPSRRVPPAGDCAGMVLRHHLRVPTLRIAQDSAADDMLGRDPLALLIGMLLDQQFPMERAFSSPRLLADRLGVDALSAPDLAAADPEALTKVFQGPPALHRY